MAPNEDRNMFAVFASLISVAAILLAAIGIIVVVNKDSGSSTSTSAPAPVAVTLSEYKISPAVISVQTGGSLTVTNSGTMVHNLSITNGPKTADLNPGQSATLDLKSLKAGSYDVICTIPGHEAAGMKAQLAITDLPAGTPAGAAAQVADTQHAANTDWKQLDNNMITRSNDYLTAVVASLKAGGGNTMWGTQSLQGIPTKGRGNQELVPTVEADGTKVFNLTAAITDWEVEPGKTVQAWTYNGMVPSPQIHVGTNEHIKVVLKNELPAGTDIHFHGITTPFKDDGVAPFTQPLIEPGTTYTYDFVTPPTPEYGMYHPHNHGNTAVVNGMFGVFAVGDLALPAGRTINGVTVPANLKPAQDVPMVLNDAGVIGLSLNGKAFPGTDPLVTNEGDWTRVDYQNEGLQIHPMHLHHVPQLVFAKDGFPLESPYWVDTLTVAPGERYSVLIQSRTVDTDLSDPAKPGLGIWAYHCHILTHAEGDAGLLGMVTAFIVVPKGWTPPA